MSKTVSVGSGTLRQIKKCRDNKDRQDAADASLVPSSSKNKDNDMGRLESLVDPYWELIDPTPDVHALFLQFNDVFFEGKLAGCEVRWSPRMTLCAGICHYEGRGGLCSIRLSKPLLTLRPRRDLVETLLHEMIHAYLFVTVRNRDRDGHGAEFQMHMNRINARAGTKITIYHSFHAEVANYQQHWWRCEGPCRNRRPFYGWVKRATNRAPGPYDYWWSRHQASCGGKFVKVKEPEGFKGKTVKRKTEPTKDENDTKQMSPNKMKQTEITGFFTGMGHVLGKGQPNESLSTEDRNINPILAAALRRQQLISMSPPASNNTQLQVSSAKPKDTSGFSKDTDNRIVDLKQLSRSAQSLYTAEVSGRPIYEDETMINIAQGPSTSTFDADEVITMVKCPVCTELVQENAINSHLDRCLA